MEDNKFGVPAGWYPDPLGLPQLRWWDAQAWTEHTSEARAPIVIQPAARVGFADDAELPTRLGFADDDQLPTRQEYEAGLPSRREQRERERRENDGNDFLRADLDTDTDSVREELSAQPLLAMTLRELEPPLTDTVDDITPGPRRASAHTNAAPAASTLTSFAEEEAPARELKKTRTYTAAVWGIALMPFLQLTASVIIVAVLGLGNNLPLLVVVWVFPYLLVLGLAAYDRLVLQVWGHAKPASAMWAFLREPGYLIARSLRTYRETGKGFATLAVFAASLTSVLVGVLVWPGLLIALFPANFSASAEQAVVADAAALGAKISLKCPAPPLIIGDIFTCVATKASGDTDSIAISLQRQNGWISWQVEDWGSWVMLR